MYLGKLPFQDLATLSLLRTSSSSLSSLLSDINASYSSSAALLLDVVSTLAANPDVAERANLGDMTPGNEATSFWVIVAI